MGRRREEVVVVLVDLSSTGHIRRALLMTMTTSQQRGSVDGQGGQRQQEDDTCSSDLWLVANAGRKGVTNASPSCLDDDDNDEATKGAAWTAAEFDASRRMALARRVCGMLPTLEGRGNECLVAIAAH